MTQPSPPASLNSSRLVKLLTEISTTDADISSSNFGERLGSLIDFSESLILSSAHHELTDVIFEKRTEAVEPAQEAFLKVRGDVVATIIQSTNPNNDATRIRLPKIANSEPKKPLLKFETYHRFYASHQRNIDSKTAHLRFQIRDEIAGFSPAMARLAHLDIGLEDTLATHTRRVYSLIPKILNQRFDALLQAHRNKLKEASTDNSDENNPKENDDNTKSDSKPVASLQDLPEQWILPGEWLDLFLKDMQGLLLAELEFRLQPILGMIEALNKEVSTQP